MCNYIAKPPKTSTSSINENDTKDTLNLFFNHINNIDVTKMIQFTMEKFLDLKLKFEKGYRSISVEVFVKTTNGFPQVISSTCFLKNSAENVSKCSEALRFRKIYDSDGKFQERSVQYQKVLVLRDYEPSKGKKNNARNISRDELKIVNPFHLHTT